VALLLVLVAAAGPVCGAWDRTTAVAGGATPSRELQAYRLVTGDVPAVPALNAGCRAVPVAGDVRDVLGMADGGGALVADVDGYGTAGGSVGVGMKHVPAFLVAESALNYEVDPFLLPMDIWKDGPLGRLRHAAGQARSREDDAAYEEAAQEYWRTVNAAVARREAFEGHGNRGGR
jgi:hypothetical protein